MTCNVRIPLKDSTAKLIAGGAKAFVLPIEPQLSYTWDINAEGWSIKEIEPFCQPGDTLYLLETWSWISRLDIESFRIGDTSKQEFQYVYKADYTGDFGKLHWRSPVTMQTKDIDKSPCRHIWTDWKIEAVQFSEITFEQCKKLGLQNVEGWFTETYPHLNMDSWVWYIEKGDKR